jgi:hypothetical protein
MKNKKTSESNGTAIEDGDLKEALQISSVIFHSQMNEKIRGFNYSKFQAINKTVETALKIYGIQSFRHMHENMMRECPEEYGNYHFSPKILLDWLEVSAKKIQESKKDLLKKEYFQFESSTIDSIIPTILDPEKRVIPNVFLRSSLFGIIRTGRRKMVKNQQIESMSQYEVFFTGEQLDQNDLDVWDSLTYMAKMNNYNDNLKTTFYELCKLIGYSRNKQAYDRIKSRVERLQIATIKITYNGKIYGGHLINEYLIEDKTGKLLITFNKDLLSIFLSKDYTITNKKIKDELGENQLASWLFRFYETHKNPIPFSIEYLKKLCGSETDIRDFKRKLKLSCDCLKKSYEKNNLSFNYKFTDEGLLVTKSKQIEITY